MYLLLSIALFVLVLALPALPALREIRRPRDDGRLHIAEAYIRDPRWFGRSYREKLAPFVAAARGDDSVDEGIQLRTLEPTRWEPVVAIPPLERVHGITIGDRIHVGHAAGIRDAYALAALTCDRDVVARTLTSDGDLFIGDGVTVLRWIDADGTIEVGAGTSLGVSASAVATVAGAMTLLELDATPGARQLGPGAAPDAEPLVVFGPLRIAAGTNIPGAVKVHGALTVEPGVRIAGTVIARGDITFAADVVVGGHVFSEANVHVGPRCRIGVSGGIKTLYAAGSLSLAGDVEVTGWVVAENRGRTL
jgi:predicted acyltransferase (DUF342 family)